MSFDPAPDERIFQEHILDASDVCINCFALLHVDRETPSEAYLENRRYWHGGRRPYTTISVVPAGKRPAEPAVMGHPPQNSPAHPSTVFCECGVDGPYERIRHGYVGPERFGELLETALCTLDQKGVALNAMVARVRAVERVRAGMVWPQYTVDEAVRYGLVHGLRAHTHTEGHAPT